LQSNISDNEIKNIPNNKNTLEANIIAESSPHQFL